MQLVERHIVKDRNYIDICSKTKDLYNQCLYYWKQSIFGKIQYFTEYELINLFTEFNEPFYRNLPAQTSQQIIKLLFKNVKAWQKSKKEYNKNPNKFLGKPKLPKYKKELFVCIFTNQQVKLRNGFIYFPTTINLKPIKTKVNNVQQVRIVPNSDHFIVEIIYKKEEVPIREYNNKWMGIDLGMNNLATCTINNSCFIINGKPLKL
jgi:putative transposase